MIYCMNMCSSSKQCRPRKYPRWFTSSIIHQIHCVRTLRKRCRHTCSQSLLEQFHTHSNKLHSDIQSSKHDFEHNLILSLNPKTIFNYISDLRSNKHTIPHLNDCSATIDAEKAQLFNQFFYSVFTVSEYVLPTLYESADSLSNITIDVSAVFSALSELKVNKAQYRDRQHQSSYSQNLCWHPLLSFTYLLYASSKVLFLLNGVYIKLFLFISLVIKLLSLIIAQFPCFVSFQVLEKIIFDKMYPYTMQYGFLTKRSMLHQLLVFISDILSKRSQFDVIYTDIKKAFDSVPHNQLLFKLWFIGIQGDLWQWFAGYLKSRSHCVSINNIISNCLPVLSGVYLKVAFLDPCYSLLNDMPESVSYFRMLLYADDGKCYRSISSITDQLIFQQDLNGLSGWSRQWSLFFNEKKFVLLRFFSSFDTARLSC